MPRSENPALENCHRRDRTQGQENDSLPGLYFIIQEEGDMVIDIKHACN